MLGWQRLARRSGRLSDSRVYRTYGTKESRKEGRSSKAIDLAKTPTHWDRLLQVIHEEVSRRDLNTLIDAALTICTGSLLQALTTRIEKSFNLRVGEHLFFFSLSLWPLVVFSSTYTDRADTLYSSCVYLSCRLSTI